MKDSLSHAAYLAKYASRLPSYAFMDAESVFRDIYRRNIWGSAETVSGFGSGSDNTSVIRRELPRIIQKYRISSILDIPCGDCNWISEVPLGGCSYTGADIVEEIVEENKRRFPAMGEFKRLDICCDTLPQADLVVCRDCLVHLSNKHVLAALDNIRRSRPRFLLMTTFTGRNINRNILTGAWRPLNFQKSPFYLPSPIELVNEECRSRGKKFADKCLGMWTSGDMAD